MRYRKLSPTGDYVFGGGQQAFLINSPAAVAQAIKTRLALQLGEWFLDTTDGTNWKTGVLGRYTAGVRDDIIRSRINNTPGVLTIESYGSTYDSVARTFRVEVTVNTIYGQATVAESI